MEILAACETPAAVISALDDLPPTLEDTYMRCLTRRQNGKLLCKPKVLKWASAPKEPLSINHLREMLAMNPRTGNVTREKMPSAESVIRAGVSLVSIDDAERLLVPAHHSVRQFLFSESLWKKVAESADFDESIRGELNLSLDDTTLEIAQLSLSHVKSSIVRQIEQRQSIKAPPIGAMIPKSLQKILGFSHQQTMEMPMPPLRRSTQKSENTDFLQYAIRNWTTLTTKIHRQASFWEDFQQVALQPNVSWGVHPWSSTGGTSNSHLRGLLGFAISHNHIPLLQLIADQPTLLQPDVYNHVLPGNDLLPALHVAAKAGYANVVKILLPFCDANGLCPQLKRVALHYAASNGHEDIVRLLCTVRRVKVDRRDINSCTSLCLAAKKDHEAVVKLLLDSGKVDPDAKDKYGQTPLRWAAKNGHEAVVKLLLDSGKVDPDAKEKYDQTPLRWAAAGGHEAVVKLLLDSGKVDPDAKDNNGQTPLQWAAAGGHEAVVKLLLDSGKVDPDAKEIYGQTPLR